MHKVHSVCKYLILSLGALVVDNYYYYYIDDKFNNWVHQSLFESDIGEFASTRSVWLNATITRYVERSRGMRISRSAVGQRHLVTPHIPEYQLARTTSKWSVTRLFKQRSCTEVDWSLTTRKRPLPDRTFSNVFVRKIIANVILT